MNFAQTLSKAVNILLTEHPRAGYALDVLHGRQCWSGADLEGSAKTYGAGYAERRRQARLAWLNAGGVIVAVGNAGRLVSAVVAGQDDYGRTLYATRSGSIWRPRAKPSERLERVA